jgi:hypothetical protein
MIHNLDISKWPGDTIAKWSSFIYQMPAMDWNWKIVDLAKVTSQNAKLATSSLLCANATRQDNCKTYLNNLVAINDSFQ